MISRSYKLYLVLKELGLENTRDLSNFTIIQKTMYILSKMGLGFQYLFKWYSNGPYCSELSNDILDLYDHIMDYKLKTNVLTILNTFLSIFKDKINDATWLRIVSSILFMRDNGNDELYVINLKNKYPEKFKDCSEFVIKNLNYFTGGQNEI